MKRRHYWLLAALVLGAAAYALHLAPKWTGESRQTPALARAPAKPSSPRKAQPPRPPAPWDEKSQALRTELLQRQPEILGRAVAALQPQRPGRIDLYTLGFAGDGEERVFANEVEYFAQLMAQRFDARGHTLSLVNSPAPGEREPLATMPNLRAALKAIAGRMDGDEDVLVLFLTSHGSREHELVVDLQLPPFVLEQIEPSTLRAALDQAGIRWRVVIVSACYSGGFVPALRDPRTLVITAARQDRTSFGCGSESRITWFGDAFLAHGLNETTDFQRAFDRARRLIRIWERRDGETPSEPQLWAGREIGPKLAAWRAASEPGPPLPFTGR